MSKKKNWPHGCIFSRWRKRPKIKCGLPRKTPVVKILPKNAALAMILTVHLCAGQPRPYAGVLGGIGTLSGDAGADVDAGAASASSYKPKNGGTLGGYAGVHWNNYISFQFDYFWNRNFLTLDSLRTGGPAAGFYEKSFHSEQHAALANVLLYFRRRSSWVRPYLSLGTGMVRFATNPQQGGVVNGVTPPAAFSETKPALHVTVGIDLQTKKGWAFRYSFAETTTANPFGARLTPPGSHVLMNFRNLFGFGKTF